MAGNADRDRERSSIAESRFREYLHLCASGAEIGIDAFCAKHPDIEDALRLLFSLHRAASLAPGSTTAWVPAPGQGSWDLGKGDRVGPYLLGPVLGEGGFGTVFLAAQEEPLRRQVALKVLKAGMDTREIVARFETERQALALMNHPGIARVYDAGATELGRPYFVMEYVPGEPITDYCDRKKLRARDRVRLFLLACEAVQHAHQKAIIHRDLKPSNVLVTEHEGKPHPKVIDFGIAKAVHQKLTDKTLQTVESQLMGTPEYMSPEQAEGTLDVDTRTDIYSLGVLLYEILSGVLPFDTKKLRSAGPAEIPRILREEDPQKPSTRLSRLGEAAADMARNRATDLRALVRQIRGDLDCIVMKAMAKDRRYRYDSASELSADLERHLRHDPVLARPPSFPYRARKFIRKHRIAFGVAAALALSGGVYAGFDLGLSRLRLMENLAELRRSIRSDDLPSARDALAVIEEDHPGMAATLGLREEVRKLEERVATERSAGLRRAGAEAWSRNRDLIRTEKELQQSWSEEVDRRADWAPVWERQAELRLWDRLREVRDRQDDFYNAAVLSLHEALKAAPPDSAEMVEVRRAIEDVHWGRYLEARETGEMTFTSTFLERQIETYGTGAHSRELSGRGKIALSSEPAGAEVYCFSYQDRNGRQVPIPFSPSAGKDDPAQGLLPIPPLQVDRVLDPRSEIQPGDRILEVGDGPVFTHEDLALRLKPIASDQKISVKVLRSGERRTVSWTPFSSPPAGAKNPIPAGRLVDPFAQFRLTFAECPLDYSERNLLGVTREDGPLELELGPGSYLFVLRKPGHADARVPVVPDSEGAMEVVRLPVEHEVPPGFVYIPEGPVRTGGDPAAFQSLPWGSIRVKGFLMSRLEVTMGEWLEFVNDPEVLQRTNEKGKLIPATETARKLMPAGEESLLLVPRETYWKRAGESGPWVCEPSGFRLDWPAFGISHLAAIEYAAWRTEKERDSGGRWTYRIPTDEEWERAARGVDQRIYVWGDYLVWSFCLSQRAMLPPRIPRPAGTHPFDESIFGIRDMNGSVCEHTTGRPGRGLPNTAYRGGSWQNTDEEFFHIASRNSLLPEALFPKYSGLRLVADLASGR